MIDHEEYPNLFDMMKEPIPVGLWVVMGVGWAMGAIVGYAMALLLFSLGA